MDIYAEKRCIEQVKSGNVRQFLLLFEASYIDLYKYVFRRVKENMEIERIVRLAFFDALLQAGNIPSEVSFSVWLYSLAKPKVWAYLNKASFPERQGLIDKDEVVEEDEDEDLKKANKMFMKLSLEEREIMKLKFLEQVADGDVMTILEIDEASIGTKIYRVVKRAHFLLFGEADDRQAVYFGELTSFMARVKEKEEIDPPEVLKITLRNELASKIERHDFAIETVPVEETFSAETAFSETPFEVKGSNDPAKIFTEAVREMRQEEALKKIKEEREDERRENLIAFFERFKNAFIALPIILFVLVLVYVGVQISSFLGLYRGYPTECNIEVAFEGDFSDGEIRSINQGISDRICGHFDEVKELLITREEIGKVMVDVTIKDWFLEYNFVKKIEDWRIKKYARTLNSDRESGEI